jgi:DNA-binding transcriptional ArsR family regulator
LDYERIAEAEILPVRLAILRLMLKEPADGLPGWSATAISVPLDLTLATASHHVRHLRDSGLIERVGDRRRRGAVETFFELSCRAP